MIRIRPFYCAFLLLAALPVAVRAGVIVVGPGGGSDYDNIPEAAFNATADDTVLVLPGTYTVGPSWIFPWPIPLTADSPTFLSQAGAELTIIEGDGTLPAFSVAEDVILVRLLVHGFTFRSVERIIAWHGLGELGAIVRFTDNIVENTAPDHVALYVGLSADCMIARNVFVGAGGGAGIGVEKGVVGWITDNEVSGYGCGISGCNAGVEVLRNHVHDCTGSGITGDEVLIAGDNVVEDNAVGFMLGGTAGMMGNVIRRNGVGIQWQYPLLEPVGGNLSGNDIYDNGTNIVAPLVEYDLDAPENWWGTTDPEEIAEGIWDCHDPEAGPCCVIFMPWCTEPIPGCEPVGIAETTSWGVVKALYMR